MRHFWSSVLFGPERKLSPIVKQANYQDLVNEILLWLRMLVPIPQESWIQVKAAKNPYSEIFLFQQNDYPDVPHRIFIKRFITQLEDKNELDLEGLKRECHALDKVASYSGMYQIYTPKLYAYNRELCCMATNYLEGVSFFNVIFESPLKVITGNSGLKNYEKSLFNLGRWLKHIHSSNLILSDRTNRLETILDKDISEIKMRIEHLKKIRPVDFNAKTCKRLLYKSAELAEQIRMDDISLQMVHGDFSLANMLYDSGRLYILDFSNSRVGIPEDDLARIYLDIQNVESFSFMLSRKQRCNLSASFLTGYGKDFGVNSLNASDRFHILKHALINLYMYTKHWGNKEFLNPFLCRLLYHYQKKILFELIKE